VRSTHQHVERVVLREAPLLHPPTEANAVVRRGEQRLADVGGLLLCHVVTIQPRLRFERVAGTPVILLGVVAPAGERFRHTPRAVNPSRRLHAGWPVQAAGRTVFFFGHLSNPASANTASVHSRLPK
jgi:hypothetical protein